jgi:glycosyltransferase involved in cell wall biosynthesis
MAAPLNLPSPDSTLPTIRPTAEQKTVRFRAARRLRQLHPVSALEEMRSAIATRQDRVELLRLRGGRDVVWQEEPEPLVTIRIATFSAGERLRVAVESALRQTYEHVEILVVGDHCDEDTARVAASYRGQGVHFLNLPRRGQYPEDRRQRWMVAGAAPMNAALELAQGSWIAPCDDDDMLTDDHVEQLVEHAVSRRLEFVWSRAALQEADGTWVQTGANQFEEGHISHGSILYTTNLRFMRYNRRAYLSERPGDWELWRRMQRAGVRMGYLDELTYYHFA